MNDLESKLLKLVNELAIEETTKQAFVQRIQAQGVSSELIEELKAIIDTTIDEQQKKTDEQIRKLETELEETLTNYKNGIREIQEQAKQESKAAQQKKDNEELEKVRKQLQ
jgi:flagellar hook-basal body complex protein FliE